MTTSESKLCPMCKGTGYYDVSAVGDKIDVEKSISLEIENSSVNARNCKTSPGDVWVVKNDESYYRNRYPDIAEDCETEANENFFGGPEKYENFHSDTLKVAIQKLKEINWESNLSALMIIVQISRFCPKMIDSSMPLVMRSLHSLLRNVRHQVVINACRIAAELFKTMQCTLKPEFDELVFALLQKTAYTHRLVRREANKALDALVAFIQPQHCIRVMSAKGGAGHKNAIVRTTVSRLLYNIIYTIGVETFLTNSTLRDARRKTFAICMQFLNDPSIETRSNGRCLIELLMTHDNFDAIFAQDVERALIKTFEKQLVSLKYTKYKPVNAFEL